MIISKNSSFHMYLVIMTSQFAFTSWDESSCSKFFFPLQKIYFDVRLLQIIFRSCIKRKFKFFLNIYLSTFATRQTPIQFSHNEKKSQLKLCTYLENSLSNVEKIYLTVIHSGLIIKLTWVLQEIGILCICINNKVKDSADFYTKQIHA